MAVTEKRIALKNVGRIDPERIADYVRQGGYEGLRRALASDPEQIIQELTVANLRGRGGAGFPTGVKERFTSEAFCRYCGLKYIVGNADEGEPGTFKDRVIMEQDPHMMLEGMIIAAYAVGAGCGYIYIRGEYHRSIRRVARALKDAYAAGYLGENILGSGFALELEIRLGAGSYLCGEELTLLESLEGKRGYPRIKPPFPAEKGLWGAPTLINNVETFAQIPFIVRHGARHYLTLGIEGSPGTKIFTISGDVARPGYYETELGLSLRSLIDDLAGGLRSGRKFKAALIGGAAGTFVDASVLDTPMGFDTLKARGAILGSGAVMVMGAERSLFEMTAAILEFFQHESCGKCVPCRVGTAHLVRLMQEARANPGARAALLDRLLEEAQYMAATSLCPLGQSPLIPLRSLDTFFRDQF
jgi:NADH:ubiquinone oxidoreductase subunit F (NADH-binding)